MVKVDLHVHTAWSDDSLTTCRDVIHWARRRRLDALAITDHNRIGGALALQEMSSLQVIVGEEIYTTRGEIIGLFLREQVPAYLSPIETIRRIRCQGGLVCVPHPMDRIRGSTLDFSALMQIVDQIDIIEVLNARSPLALYNRQAEELAHSHGLLRGAGSDAHQGFEIGRAYLEMPAFNDARSFLRSLSRGRVRGRISSPLVHLGSTCARFAKGLMAAAPFAR